MDRKEFINMLGLSAAALLFTDTLSGCAKNDFTLQPVDFTIDLNDPQYTRLNHNGSFTYVNDVIIARTTNGDLIALSKICTHQGCTVAYNSNQDNFQCPCHGSTFSDSGRVIRGPANNSLALLNADLTGTSLHVYS